MVIAKTRRKSPARYQQQLLLRESVVTGAGAMRVDRAAGVIYGVKVVGLTSTNNHGIRQANGQLVEGTDYLPEAIAKAKQRYEGINVNVNHTADKDDHKPRDPYDRFAWLQETRIIGGELYADLHFLDPADPLAVRMFTAAEKKPDAFALSHNAYGVGVVREGRYIVTDIPDTGPKGQKNPVSVDIVTDGGTNASLRESKESERDNRAMTTPAQPIIKPLRAIIYGSKNADVIAKLPKLKKFLESAYGDTPMTEDEETPEMGWDDHMGEMVKTIMCDTSMSTGQKREKVNKALKLLDEDDEDDEDEDDEEDEPVKEADEDAEEDDDKEKEPKKAKESRRGKRKPPAGTRHLKESVVKCMLSVSGIKETPALIKTLKESGSSTQALSILAAIKESAETAAKSAGIRRSDPRGAPGASGGGATGGREITGQSIKRCLNGRN